MQQTLPATNQHQTQTVSNSYQQNQNDQTVINPANTVTNFSGNSYKNILLQTANAEVINLDNRNSEKCNILFDSGAQLNVLPIRHETISIKVFGTTDSKIQETETVKFKVKYINKNIFVEALVIPTICSTLTKQGSDSVLLSKYLHLRDLRLAQNSMESSLNIDVLIGLDNYYDFICSTVIRGKYNDSMALESTLAWIISGPYSIDNETNVYNGDSHF